MKPVPALVIFVAGLLTGTLLAWFALRPEPRPRPTRDAHAATTDATELVEVARAEIVDHDGWAKQGFARMVPPVRLPTDAEERDVIEVWLRVPDGQHITARALPDGRRTIKFPPGTVADRVERWGYAKDGDSWKLSVTDVRGTRLADDGTEMFHVFVPVDAEPHGRLVGWEWPRGDHIQQRAATAFLLEHLETTRTIQDQGKPMNREERKRFLADYRRNNDCASCHEHNKPEQTSRPGGIHRATDDDGFFVPLSVLMDTVPFEHHRPRDRNVGDRFLTLSCPDDDTPVLTEGQHGARAYRCMESKGSPSATRDIAAGVAAQDAYTLAVCRSRAYLREHMDEAARALFADAFTACGL